jgi:uncharacterized protein YdbL (DUF1318 family)
MRRVLPLKIALASLLIGACVTINVYFPAAAADKAADQVIDNITKGGASPPQSYHLTDERPDYLVAALGSVLNAVVPAARAQDAAQSIDVSSPAITQITASMGKRYPELDKYFSSGAVGLTNSGNVDVRDLNSVPLPERATVKRLVSEDNADRAALYAEVAKANNHPEWEGDIRKSFARRWVAKAKAGTYYQDDAGAWKQK